MGLKTQLNHNHDDSVATVGKQNVMIYQLPYHPLERIRGDQPLDGDKESTSSLAPPPSRSSL